MLSAQSAPVEEQIYELQTAIEYSIYSDARTWACAALELKFST
jgi:hypothetical protein